MPQNSSNLTSTIGKAKAISDSLVLQVAMQRKMLDLETKLNSWFYSMCKLLNAAEDK